MSDLPGDAEATRARITATLAELPPGLRQLLGAVQELVMVVGADGHYLHRLPTRYGQTAQPGEQVGGWAIDDILAPDDCARLRQVIGRVLAGGQAERVEYPIGAGASRRWFDAEISAIPELPGCTLWVVRETSAERSDQARLRLFDAALAAAANAIVITDPTACILWVNPAFSALTGYASDEAIGRNPRDLVKSGKQDRAFYADLWTTITRGDTWHGELINRRKDGSLYEEQQTITPVRDATGTILHYVAIKQDVSAAKSDQRRLELLGAALDAASNGVLITDAEGLIVYVNPAYSRISGFGQDEALGRAPGDLVQSGQSPPEHFERFWAALRSGQPWQGEMINRHKDGHLYTEAQTVTPVHDAQGRISHFVAITEDVSSDRRHRLLQSEQRRLLERLARGEPLPELLAELTRAFEAAVPGMLCSILLLDDTGTHLGIGAASSLPAAFNAAIDGIAIGPEIGSCGRAAATDHITIASDIATDSNWQPYRELAAEHGLCACWSLPVHGGGGNLLGTFAVYFRTPRSPSPDELADLRQGADLTGLVIERKRMLHRLLLSEQRFAQAVGAAEIGVWSYQVATQSVYCSPLLKRLLGYADDQLQPTLAGWTERTHPDDRAALAALLSGRPVGTAPHHAHQVRLRHANGDWRWYHICAAVETGPDGTPVELVGTAEDITERKQTERLQTFLSQHRIAVDSGQFFRELGAFLAELLGAERILIARVRASGDHARTEVWFNQGQFLDPIEYPLAGTPCATLLSAPICSYPAGVSQRFPDDPLLSKLAIESYLGVTLCDSRGRPIGFLSALDRTAQTEPERCLQLLQLAAHRVADLLERQQLDERIQASEQVFRTLFEQAADAMLLLRDGRFVDCNVATVVLLGYQEKEQFLGRTPAELSPEFQEDGEPSVDKAAKMIAAALAAGQHRFEWEHLRADGSVVPVEVSLTALEINGETVLHTSWRDISARRKADALLRRAMAALDQRNRALQDFAFVASHDLQEPLRKIRTFSDLVLARPEDLDDAKARDYLQRSSQAATRMQVLIDDLLVLSRLGSQSLRVTAVALDPLIDQVLGDLDARIEASGARIERDPLPVIEGDATQLQQLFQNLLANALKFHAPNQAPRIRIHLAPARLANQVAAIEIRIEDDGIGFDPAEAERIFAPFRRLHGRDQYEGTGMGLAIVKRIVDAHGGQIDATSTPGQGACFRVLLPLRQSP